MVRDSPIHLRNPWLRRDNVQLNNGVRLFRPSEDRTRTEAIVKHLVLETLLPRRTVKLRYCANLHPTIIVEVPT